MPQTRECDYCGADIEPGTGTMFVRKNGSTVHFCSSKCEKNADLGREARDLSWTEAGGASTQAVEDEPDEEVEAEPEEEPAEGESDEVQSEESDVEEDEDAAEAEADEADAEDADTEEPTEADA